ncbi:hypothetical protein SAMN05216375_1086 [Trichococcus ilyis]|uniref:Uncharacterized protein n=1 Tax=Trichococcus ilyis TaxID=640938 RepID=A0A143YW47_9LACT|nr:Hypothetical protein TR210_1568 [Trichococcus ilyis]SEJ11713.1 hypothetical protein SAMN05216375_1086 [Trichococcus ilyis]
MVKEFRFMITPQEKDLIKHNNYKHSDLLLLTLYLLLMPR